MADTSSRYGGTRSLSFCASTMPMAAPIAPHAPAMATTVLSESEPDSRLRASRAKTNATNPKNSIRSAWKPARPRAAAGRPNTSRRPVAMSRKTRRTSSANREVRRSCSSRSTERATIAATRYSAAPKSATIHEGARAVPTRATPPPTTWKMAPPACDRPFAWSRSLPCTTVGSPADLIARRILVQAKATRMARTRTASGSALPPAASASAASPTAAARNRFDRISRSFRSYRSMNAPTNGLTSVYGT